jgi:hypothetical protein
MLACQWASIAEAPGVLQLEVSYETGNQTSRNHLPALNPVLVPALGCAKGELFAGSLNLRADGPVVLPSPAEAELDGFVWHFVPILLERGGIGVVARRSDSGDIPFLEVFACDRLNAVLRLSPGDRLKIRLLPGRYLDLAA